MNAPDANSKLVRLINRYCDGVLEPAEFEELQSQLRQDAAARLLFRDVASLHANLIWDQSQEHPLPVAPTSRANAAPQQMVGISSASRDGRTPVLRFLGSSARSLRKPVFWSILAVAAAFYGTFVLISWNILPGVLPKGTDSSETTVAMIGGGKDVRWSDENSPKIVDPEVKPGEPLKIDSGVVHLQLTSGVKLRVEGPARWAVDGENLASLQAGRLVASVPPRAVGFKLVTPSAQVVDLGTEFAVEVDGTGKTDVLVLVGSVEVDASTTIAAPATAPMLLNAGQAVRIEPGKARIADITINSRRFANLIEVAAEQSAAKDELAPPSVIPLGNLLDDPREKSLWRAIETNEFAAAADIDDLGVERALYGGESIKRIAPLIDFDLSPLGWTEKFHAQVGNDGTPAPVPGQDAPLKVGMRSLGRKMNLARERIEDGLGIVSNSLITFDLNEIRAAGKLQASPLRLIVDRAGINDEVFNDPLPSAYAVVLVSDAQGVQAAYLNGVAVKIARRESVWEFVSPVGKPLLADGHYVKFDVPLPRAARYLTLIVACAGDQIDGDFVVWSGARLEVTE